MATGDTVTGAVRVVLEDTQGNQNVVLGSLPQSKVDYTNNDVSPDEKTYVNTMMSSRVTAPAGAQTRRAPDAVFEAGEKLIVQHQSADDSDSQSIDLDADSFDIEGVAVDLNRDNAFIEVKAAADSNLSGTVAEDEDDWVNIYQTEIPDRTRFFMAGAFEAVALQA
jgi:hypothetical protein